MPSFYASASNLSNSYDVAADGRFLMIQSADGSGGGIQTGIVVVQNWLTELERLAPRE